MNSKKLTIILSLTLLLAAFIYINGCVPQDNETSPEAEKYEAKEAGDIQFTDMQGNIHSLWDYEGQAVMLNFWATWCPPCRYEKPFMQEIYEDYKEEGFIILAVSVREDKETVQNYIDQHGYTYPVFLDLYGEAFSEYDRTGGIPQTFLIDRQGNIDSFVSGARDWRDPANRQLIEEILNTY